MLERLWRWVARRVRSSKRERRDREEGMILASVAIRGAHRDVVEAAQSDARTLTYRCLGAGKEMLAEVFHRHSGRSGAFVAVNCAMFSKDLLRSELFGAEPGSLQPALHAALSVGGSRAQGGTLFRTDRRPTGRSCNRSAALPRSREFEQLGQYGAPAAPTCASSRRKPRPA